MPRLKRIIDERQLASFRACELAPAQLYEQIPDDDRVVLVGSPPGVGKSWAAQALAEYALQRDHDLVIYTAPTRAIIGELDIVHRLAPSSVVVLEPRPRRLCGDADPAWKDFERSGCAALGKATLCEPCAERDGNGGKCSWPDQLNRIGPDTRLVVMTEQYLSLNPQLVRQIRGRAKPHRQLLLLDEGLFVKSAIVRRFTRTDLRRFREALTKAQSAEDRDTGVNAWLDGIDFLLDPDVELEVLRRFWRNQLRFSVLEAQRAGHRMFGSGFRYLAPELELLNSTVTTGQWRDGDNFEIVARVDTEGSDVVIMAAYLDADIVEERLSRPAIPLFSDIVFRHSKTRVLNIADPIGTATTLSCPQHFDRVVDFFTALALRNAARGFRTVLVARKQFVRRIGARIEGVSAALDRPLKCVQPSSGKPFDRCEPTEIAVINYGTVGINSLQSFDALYCIGGYYARSDHLNDVYQQSLPPNTRMPIRVRMEGRRRRVYAADRRFNTRYHARRAEATHRMIERHVVLQAVGRIRPFTTPAEVILFQCDDLSGELGSIDEFASLAVARRALKVPTLARMKRAALGERIRARQKVGESLRAIGAGLGISPSTALLAAREEQLDRLLAEIRL